MTIYEIMLILSGGNFKSNYKILLWSLLLRIVHHLLSRVANVQLIIVVGSVYKFISQMLLLMFS